MGSGVSRPLRAQLADEQRALGEASERVGPPPDPQMLCWLPGALQNSTSPGLRVRFEQLGRAEGRTDDSAEQLLARRERILRTAEGVARQKSPAGPGATAQQNLATRYSCLDSNSGIEALEQVTLRGNATLIVYKGGERTSYSRCTRGEQLRLKVATAVALLRVGFTDGVGRHPGLLLVDSPGAEEAASENLDAMLSALKQVTADVPYLQVVVATRSPESLERLLEEDRRRIAPIGGYVW